MIKNLSSQELVAHAKRLVSEERRITTALIESLVEIDRRRLYAELSYSSLWEFVTRELGLSESSANRRIQAARLLQDAPEAKVSLENGKLSLSNAAKIQSFRRAERKLGRKRDASRLVKEVESLSQRECEIKLFEVSPEALPREQDRGVSAKGERELKFVVSAELYDKLQRIRGLIAHAKPEASFAELLQYLADEQLARLEKKNGIVERRSGVTERKNGVAEKNSGTEDQKIGAMVPTRTSAAEVKPLPVGLRVYLPVTLKKAIWARSGGRCEFERAARRCTSRYRLQLDHIVPLALGGANELGNLRQLCRGHNLQQAREKLGT